MEQYISKATVEAEIERIKKEECPIDTYEGRMKLFYFERFLSFLDTLEVKEVVLKENHELTWEDVAWITNKAILKCKEESTLTAEDICKDVLKQFKAQKGK